MLLSELYTRFLELTFWFEAMLNNKQTNMGDMGESETNQEQGKCYFPLLNNCLSMYT